jgi:hypothetical protein
VRRFGSWRRFRRLLLASGGRSGPGGGEESRDRWPVYILSPISLYLGRFTLYPSLAAAATASAWSPMTSGVVPCTDKMRYVVLVPVAFYCWPVLLSLREVFGDGGGVEAFSGDGFVGFVFSLLEKSGWLLSPRLLCR